MGRGNFGELFGSLCCGVCIETYRSILNNSLTVDGFRSILNNSLTVDGNVSD